MLDPIIAAYVAFAFLVIITVLGTFLSHRYFRTGPCHSAEVGSSGVKIQGHIVMAAILWLYLSVGLTFVALTDVRGPFWAELSWRWSIGGAFLDSLCAIYTTKITSKFERLVPFQVAIASIEAVLIVGCFAIRNLQVSRYLTLGLILCHASWTAASAWFWTPTLNRTIRLGASIGQGLSALALIWCILGFVVLFYLCTIAIFIEEFTRPQRPFCRMFSGQRPIASGQTSELLHPYRIVFIGKPPQTSDLLRRVLKWPTARIDLAGVKVYDHPTRRDTILASVPPNLILAPMEKESFILSVIKGASAVVLVFSLHDANSFEQVKGLRGFPTGQPGLLVACQNSGVEHMVSEQTARHLAANNGWEFTMASNVDVSFENMMNALFARPALKRNDYSIARSRFIV